MIDGDTSVEFLLWYWPALWADLWPWLLLWAAVTVLATAGGAVAVWRLLDRLPTVTVDRAALARVRRSPRRAVPRAWLRLHRRTEDRVEVRR